MKIDIDLEGIKHLLSIARTTHKVDAWADLAIEWMDSADLRINELELCSCGRRLSIGQCEICDNDD